MKANKPKALLILLVLSVFVVSCEKQDELENELHFYKISESLHPFLFTEGSSWIYSNLSNAAADTVVIIDFESDELSLGPTGPGQGPRGSSEFFNISYQSSFSDDFEEQLIGSIISRGLISGGYTYLSGFDIGEENGNAVLVDIIDTLTVGNLIFNDVVKMDLSADNHLHQDLNLYYVDSIGVVKKEVKQNNSIIETWNLVEYDVSIHQIE